MNFVENLLAVERYQNYYVIKITKFVKFNFAEFGVEDSGRGKKFIVFRITYKLFDLIVENC